MRFLDDWKLRVRELKRETYTLYLACRDPRTPWYARWLAVGVVACAFSPIDLIPDFIPVLGLLDDLVLVPLGIYLVWRMIPVPIRDDCRQRAQAIIDRGEPTSRVAAAVIVTIWLLLATWGIYLIVGLVGHWGNTLRPAGMPRH